MKKSSRGSVGKAFAKAKRYKEDEEWRNKRRVYQRERYHKNRDRELAKMKEWVKKLNKFANKKCKVCGRLLNYRTKSGFCREHHLRWKRKTKNG